MQEEEHHHHDHHHPVYFDIDVWQFTRYLTKDTPMSTTPTTIVDGQSTLATAGQTRDASGNATSDPVASGSVTWTSSDPSITLTPSADTLSVTVTIPANTPVETVTISGTATTVGGASVGGTGTLSVNTPPVGPAVTFDVTFSTPA